MVKLAKENGETLYPKNNNANPLDSEGEEIPLWEMSPDKLIAFIDYCEGEGITFVATEWGTPSIDVLKKDDRVVLVTVFRNPLARFQSNFRFSYFNGYVDCKDPFDYVGSLGAHTMFNYYCRVFSYNYDNPEPIDRDRFKKALRNVSFFDLFGFLESDEPLREISKGLGWTRHRMKANETKLDCKSAARYVLKGRPKLLFRRLRLREPEKEKDFADVFRKKNKWDFKLYNKVKEIYSRCKTSTIL